jgi:hypothetical protein
LTPDELARTIKGQFNYVHAHLVIGTLARLGYTFVPHGTPGRYHESAEQQHGMALALTRMTGVRNVRHVRGVLEGCEAYGLRIREPDLHPSGIKTHRYGYETVPRTTAEATRIRIYRP